MDWDGNRYRVLEDTTNRGRRNAAIPSQLPQALSLAAFTRDGFAIKVKRSASDVPAFETRSAHTGLDPLDDQAAFEFRDGTHDDDDGPAQRAARIDLFAESDELDLQVIQLIENLQEMGYGPRDPVEGPDQHHIEPTAPCIAQQFVQARTFGLGAADRVGVFLCDLIAALGGQLTQVVQRSFQPEPPPARRKARPSGERSR